MKYNLSFFSTFFLMMFITSVHAQLQHEWHYRAKVRMEGRELRKLAETGVDVTHGYFEKNCCFTSDFSGREIEQIRANGFEVEIEIENVAEHYVRQNLSPSPTASASRQNVCEQSKPSSYTDPQNFELGSMGGYFTYAEILDHLDLMHIKYPNLISARAPIGEFKTYHGRPIFYVRISNNPDLDQDQKPKVLHTSLHHAREPISVSQLIYFMWYLLENYESDPYVRALVDATEVYFVPVMNVDGYLFNEQNNPSGGGMHRKNRRLLAMGNWGVDLNRNYDFMWGLDNSGSSPNQWDETYRGPSPASEPEVRAIQFLCGQKGFDIALNHHSFGNALLYPFGYADVPVPDQQTFFSMASAMTGQNNYDYGRPWEVPSIGYATNGSSDDWMYGEFTSKPPIFSFTPEIGSLNQGFWPHRSDILPLCNSTLGMNLTSMSLVNNYAEMQEMTPEFIGSSDSQLLIKLQRKGLKDGEFRIEVTSLTPNVSIQNPGSLHQLLPNASLEHIVQYQLSPGIQIGDIVRFALELDMGDIITRDTIEKIYMGDKSERFTDNAISADNWVVEGLAKWGVDESTYFSAPTCISDSPGDVYAAGATSTMRLFQPVNLANATAAYLTFRARWYVEPGADFVTISASDNGFIFTPLCGRFTKPGNRQQQDVKAMYDGFQDEWVLEVMDLQEYLGKNLFLQVSLTADGTNQFDGFFMDDIRVVAFESGSSTEKGPLESEYSTRAFPNPASDRLFIEFIGQTKIQATCQIEIFDMLGSRVMYNENTFPENGLIEMSTRQLNNGMYMYRIRQEGKVLGAGRFGIRR
jgi:carboxypeptidase T